MNTDFIIGIKCPVCDKETLSVLRKHFYGAHQFGLKWYYCSTCDKDYCKDKYTSDWKIAPYDIDIPEDSEEEEE